LEIQLSQACPSQHDLLQLLFELDLVEHVASIQYAIRLSEPWFC
jgi:hypothetical protein